MAQHTLFIKFYYPNNVMDITSYTENEIKKSCFIVSHCDTEEEALDAYEQTKAPWSIILDDDEDVNKFIDEAYEHLKSNDLNDRRWLYKHFV